ncbi:MAG: mechanosensitive ion channel family protein [Chloroflexi bacterium]|nr:mechanosensitive ion channel family protein [Chloroflexota bacterium]
MDQFISLWGPASPLFWVRVLWALVAFLIIAWIAGIAHQGTRRALERTRARQNMILFSARVAQLGILVLGAMVALGFIGVPFADLAALVGLATLALSVSLQDIIRNLLAGLYLLIEHPFEVGDKIDISGQLGVIEDVGMRTTILRDRDDNRVIVPNLVMFNSVITQKKQVAPETPTPQDNPE